MNDMKISTETQSIHFDGTNQTLFQGRKNHSMWQNSNSESIDYSIGGGYAAMPLIQNQVVDLHPWLSMTQFADIMTIAEMTPGPIAINSATFVGIQVAGLPGAIIATIGCVFPSCVIVMTLACIYYRFRGLNTVQGILAGLRPAVIAMIASAGISLISVMYGSPFAGTISVETRMPWNCLLWLSSQLYRSLPPDTCCPIYSLDAKGMVLMSQTRFPTGSVKYTPP